MLYYNNKLKPLARQLRSSMTEAEKRLWSKIRRKQLRGRQFYRQRIIGNYIVDFYCPKDKLVIELDGGQHFTEKGKKSDRQRDQYLRARGLTVIRISDRDVLCKLDSVLEYILSFMHD